MMKHKRLLSLTILLCLSLSLLSPEAWAEEEERTLHISSPQQLSELSVSCAEDSYSRGLTVILDKDIDLADTVYYPIPSFSGTFLGEGHSILNMETGTNGSHQGLFRYIQAEGRVCGLKVQGRVCPEGSRNQIGGIAGINYGSIEDCGFSGTVKGLSHVGGIAGINYGSISSCESSGTADGKCSTGGIAGKNEGSIDSCQSAMRVNTSITQEKLELDEISLSDITNLDVKSVEDEDVVSDSGGIAGYSTGIIGNSVNRGTVGYMHYGYNVGGIAGRQSGYIYSCENYGQILGRKDVGGIVGQMEPFMILSDSVNLPAEIGALSGMVAGTMGNVGSLSGEVSGALNGGYYPPQGENGGISDAGGGITGGGGIGGESGLELPDWVGGGIMDSYTQAAGSLVDTIGSSAGAMAQGLVGISNQLAHIVTILAGTLSGEDRTLIDDISEEIPEDDIQGRVRGCTNLGSIDADKNVGGIAGEMGIEYDFDLEGTLAEFFGVGGVLSATYQTKCVSEANVNKGSVLGKKDNVGGIVGLEKLGTVTACQGYGSVRSSEGTCVGGIAGRSESSVRRSYAMCNISGGANIGGIAGYGTIISDCGSLVGIGDISAACCGAIAGWADITQSGNISGNLYVHERIGAVDGISYEAQAEKLSYDEFLQIEGLPEQFRKLKLSFTAGGETVEELEFEYGGSINEEDIPPVPEREGYSGHWPEYDYTGLYFSDTLEAVYTPRQAAIASKELREGTPHSLILLEGDFSDSAELSVNPYEGENPAVGENRILEKWVMQVSDRGGEALESYKIRFAEPQCQGRVRIYVLGQEGWESVSTGQNGSYITFPGSGERVIFCAVETEDSGTLLWVLIPVLLVLLLLTVIIIRRRKKAAPAPEAEEKTEEAEEGEKAKSSGQSEEPEDNSASASPETEERAEVPEEKNK